MLKRSLKYFMAVARHGSIRAASAELNVAQSAVSRQLQALEYELGVELLERHTHGVALTQAGELLQAYGRAVSFDAERLISELDALRGLRRGHVRLAMIESLVPNVLPRALDRFLKEFPGITFGIDVTTTDRVVAAVRDGSAEAGVGFSPDLPGDVRTVFSLRERMLAIVAADHPLAASSEISVRDLIDFPVVLAPKLTGARLLFERGCAEAGVTISPSVETPSVELCHQLTRTGAAVGVLMRLSCLNSIEDGSLKAIPFKEKTFNTGRLDAIALADRRLPLAAEKFLAVLQGAAGTGQTTHK